MSYVQPFIPLLGGLLGAFFGSILAFWLRGFETKHKELGDRVDDVVGQIHKLQEVCLNYWSREVSGLRGNDDRAQEGEILGRVHAINIMVEDLVGLIKEARQAELRAAVIDLRQSVSSGDFASDNGRKANPLAIQSCFRAGVELMIRLRRVHRKK